MTASLAWQYAIVGLAVALSALAVLRKYLPAWWGRLLARIADLLEMQRMPQRWQRAGAALRARIPASVGSGCATSGGCSSCGACASTPISPPPVLRLADPVRPPRRG